MPQPNGPQRTGGPQHGDAQGLHRGFAFDLESVRRIGRAVRFVDRISRENVNLTLGASARRPGGQPDNETVIWPVVVMGDPPGGSADLSYLYPGLVYIPNADASPPWDTLPCWVIALPGRSFTEGDAGNARLVGWRPAGNGYDALPIYSFVAGPADSSNSQSWIAGLTTDCCIKFEVVSVEEGCADVAFQTLYLEWDSDQDWVSDGDFYYSGSSGSVVFTRAAPVPELTIAGVSGYYLGTDNNGFLFAFGGASLCAAGYGYGYADACCGANTFIVCVSCAEGCPDTEGAFAPDTLPVSLPAGQLTVIPVEVGPITNGTAPNLLQFQLDASGVTGGLSQFQVVLVAPNGEQFQLFNEPPSATAAQMQIFFDMTAAGTFQAVVDSLGPVLGLFQAVEDYTDYTGNPNGIWQLQVTNDGDAAGELTQFQIVFGTPATNLAVTGSADPTSGDAPLDVEIDGAFDDAGNVPYLFSVDFDDGNGVQWFLPSALPLTHEFDTAGAYEVIITPYTGAGASGTDSVVVTVDGEGPTPGASCGEAPEVSTDVEYGYTGPSSGNEHWFFLIVSNGSYHIDQTNLSGAGLDTTVYPEATGCGDLGAGLTVDASCESFTVTNGRILISIAYVSASPDYTFKISSGSCP